MCCCSLVPLDAVPNSGVVLSLLDDPAGGDPGFHVVWSRFRIIRRSMGYQPGETGRTNQMLQHVSLGCVGHGHIHFLVHSAGLIGIHWDTDFDGWKRSGLTFVLLLSDPTL